MILSKRNFIWLAILVFLLFTATSINFSWVQRYHNSDSLLVTLISLDHYTPFYWGENRFGQPGPLILSFIRDYRANLFGQTELLVSASLGCVVLFNLYFFHASLSKLQRMSAAMLSIVFCLCILSSEGPSQMLAMGAQPYMPSLFLTLLAAALLFRMPSLPDWVRAAGALFCLLLAFWLNASVAVIALGLTLCLDFNPRDLRWKQRLGGLLIVAASLGANAWFAGRYPGPRLLVFEPMADWVFGLRRLSWRVWPYFFHLGRLLAFLAVLLAVLLSQRTWRRVPRNYCIPDVLVFLVAAICYAAAIARVEWVGINRYATRYWTIPAMLFLLLVTGWTSAAFIRLLSHALRSEGLTLFCTATLLAVAVFSIFGLPSYGKAAAYLAESTNRFDADERALGCTHLVGSYWIGWTSVFQRESSGGPPIYAITNRSEVTRDRWDWAPGRLRTYCGEPGDSDRERWIRAFGLPPLRETVRAGTLCKLEITAAPVADALGRKQDPGKPGTTGRP
jgi:hypothetical protein